MFKKKEAPAESGNKKEKGKLLGSMKTSMSGALAQAKTGTKNTQQTVKIQLTQQKLVDAKHKFGVEYMDLLLQGASEDKLQECVDTNLQEVKRLVGKLDKYQGIISNNKQKLEQKLSKQTGQPPPHTQPSIQMSEESTNASAEAASFPDLEATSSAGAASSNPFDQEEEDEQRDSKAMPVSPSVPMAEAIPVSDTNNPFDDDDDEEEKKPSSAKAASGSNPFGGDDDESNGDKDDAKAKSNSVNPFDDDEDDDEEEEDTSAKPTKPASANPFDDDDDEEAPSKPKGGESSNPFDD